MKKFIFFARVYSLWTVALAPNVLAQDSTIVYPNYVVIGAFAFQDNAVEFIDDAKKHNFSARSEVNPNRNLHYVYVLTTDDRLVAFEEARKLRKETKYFDTWVYSGPLGDDRGHVKYTSLKSQDFNPETGAHLDAVNAEHTRGVDSSKIPLKQGVNESGAVNSATTEPASEEEQPKAASRKNSNGARSDYRTVNGTTSGSADQTVRSETPAPSKEQTSEKSQQSRAATQQGLSTNSGENIALEADGQQNVATNLLTLDTSPLTETGKKAIAENLERLATLGPPPVRATTAPLTSEEVAGKDFYFYLFRGDNLVTVDGEVDAIDFEKARRMASYQGNTPVRVIMPSGNSKQMSFVCQVFGYRKEQREFDPASPTDDLYLDEKGNLVVPFELSRLQKGDIAIMYNVFFFKDAAVMRPESRYEVSNLLEFLVENPAYKIMIHGHTNGNAAGKIIRMEAPGNFYSLAGTKQGYGSAKQLSEERANVIREFLIATGISPDRMAVRAWGGKKPIHDKHSVRANENVRVEIEILSE